MQIMQTQILKPTKQNLTLCAEAIRGGNLVAFPTETVYGLGANALDEAAVKKIFLAKGRPSDNPLIVHLDDKQSIERYAEVTNRARLIIDAFMPGAITILLPKKPLIPDIVTAGRATVGVRIPDCRVALQFLQASGLPICAPSANTSTRPSPTSAQHVFDDLGGKIGYILDGGDCNVGIESTIIDLTQSTARLLRKGGISKNEIEDVLKEEVIISDFGAEAISPGLKYKHYSPLAKVILVKNSIDTQKNINEILNKQLSFGYKTIVLCYNENIPKYPEGYALGLGKNDTEATHNYYALLRQLDKDGTDVIIVESPKESSLGLALLNRMQKSAGGQIVE